jgi:hypothetical protein
MSTKSSWKVTQRSVLFWQQANENHGKELHHQQQFVVSQASCNYRKGVAIN